MGKRLNTYWQSDPLGRRVLAYILICSTFLAFLSTGLQLLLDYRHGVSGVELRLDEIERGYADSIGASLWTMDEQQTGKQLAGIAKLPGIAMVELRDPAGKLLGRAGAANLSGADVVRRTIPIKFSEDGSDESRMALGALEVTASLGGVYSELQDKVLLILVAQSAKTAIVVLFTLYIFRRLVSRHLSTIADYARRLDLSNLGEALRLRRRRHPVPDELDVVVTAFNDMAGSIRRDVEELARYRKGLEELVAVRTEELALKVAERTKRSGA
jgi:methyl-accepting chemotaxis protein